MTPTQITIKGFNGVEIRMSERSYELACEGAAMSEQQRCAAKGHKPYVIATRSVDVGDPHGKKARVRYCTGCGMEFGPHAGRQS